MRVLPYGERAVLIEVDTSAAALHLHTGLGELSGVIETVPAARTVLVTFDERTDRARLTAHAAEVLAREHTLAPVGEGVTLTVSYDGADLASTADELGISVDELVERHVAAEYVVGFCGFSPGFAYLTGLDPRLHVARLDTPRTSVPSGSVAIAGEYTGVYPRRSPGGWRLLGRTDAVIWDVTRPDPALLAPGTIVRFRAA